MQFFRSPFLTNYHEKIKQIKLPSEQNLCMNTNPNNSTLFRSRNTNDNRTLNLDGFTGIISFNKEEKYIDVGGKTTFYDLVNFTLKHNLVPKVVPELSSITVGGAISGIGIESNSWKYGFPHDTALEMDVLMADGKVHTCQRSDEIFRLFPNSYGTFGYILRVRLELITCSPYVNVRNTKFVNLSDALVYIEHMKTVPSWPEFFEILMLSPNEIIVSISHFTDKTMDFYKYPYRRMYYQMLSTVDNFTISTFDYYWRWDSDSYWGIKDIPILNSYWTRRLFGRSLFNFSTLRSTNRFIRKYFTTGSQMPPEKIIQDIGIPENNTVEFIDWEIKNIGIFPLWICGVHTQSDSDKYPLWPMKPNTLYYDVGIFGSKKVENTYGDYNKAIEQKMFDLDGLKCFYSSNYISKDEFDKYYNGQLYEANKKKYDPEGRFPNLFQKISR